jgi:hypothetical protein
VWLEITGLRCRERCKLGAAGGIYSRPGEESLKSETGWRRTSCSPRPNSLMIRERTGNFRHFGRLGGLVAAEQASSSLGFPSEFPNQPNRELFSRNRELFRRNREFAQQNRELLSNPKSPL